MSRDTYLDRVDHACPEFAEMVDGLLDDPMTEAYGAPVDDILEGRARDHLASCEHCKFHAMTARLSDAR